VGSTNPGAYNGTPFYLSDGDELRFRGQSGVDFSIFQFGGQGEALVGNVRHHYIGPGKQLEQFRSSTGSLEFEESFYLLRLRLRGRSDVIIVPYPANERPLALAANKIKGGLQLRIGELYRELPDEVHSEMHN
jgi:hypothetical protein